jgi:hypothetical protein
VLFRSTYNSQGRWAEAEKLDVQVLETSKTALGPEHPDTLIRMKNLSVTLKDLGRHAEASSLLQERQLDPDNPNTAAAAADLKARQKSVKYSTSLSPFHLKYISKTISTVRRAIKFRKK